MKVVIAGGTGFLGSHLAGVLAASGHEIAVLTRGAAARALRDARYVAWRPGDDTDDWTERLAASGLVSGAIAIVDFEEQLVGRDDSEKAVAGVESHAPEHPLRA